MATVERVFDKRSKTLKRDLAAFENELVAFERRVAPASIVLRTRREGALLRVTALSGVVKQAPLTRESWVVAWRP